MGVLACDRGDCQNIMCEYYSDEYGYICNDCLDELLLKPYSDIADFMASDKFSNIYEDDWEALIDGGVFKSRFRE